MLLLMLINQGVAAAQDGQAQLFEETGYWVTGEFLEFYRRIPNAEIILGNPFSSAFDSNLSKDPAGTQIQYFERGRLELHPENPPGLRVTMTLIGEYLYDHDDIDGSVEFKPRTSGCRNFPHDGYPVCYAFLSFFEENGGIAQFGYPISELVIHEGRLVQYFQRARFEWHPERPNGYKVSLSDIGWEYFNAINENRELLGFGSNWIPPNQVILHIHAFVDRAVMAPNGMQEVLVVVHNQRHEPLSGAHVTIQVHMPSGASRNFSMPLTNSNGISQVSFIVPDEPAGLAQIIIEVRTGELYLTSETSFRIWK
jgi:hypothetical protein